MNKTSAFLFIDRVKRVCIFDSGVYKETRKSFLSASFVVLLVALSHGTGGAIRAQINNWNPRESFIFGFQGEMLFWLVQSLIYFIIAKLLNKSLKLVDILSSVGYAIFPGILVIVASILQLMELSVPILIVIAIYRLSTCTVALQQLLNIKLLSAFMMVVAGVRNRISLFGFFH